MGIPETAKTPFQQDGSKKNTSTAKIKNNIGPVSRLNFRDFSLIPVPKHVYILMPSLFCSEMNISWIKIKDIFPLPPGVK